MDKEKIIYEPHPVTPERKQELRNQGYKIIDAQFDPDPKPPAPAEKPKELKKLKIADLQAILTEKGIAFETDANKDALIALIEAAEKPAQ